MSDELLERIVGLIGKETRREVESYVLKRKIPITRLVAIALDHELSRKEPFKYDTLAPSDEYVPLAYAEDAGKIITYLTRSSGMSLEMLCMVRNDIGISDKKMFMLAFRECLLSEQIESYTPKQSALSKFKYDDDYVFYRVKGSDKRSAVKARRKANKYETYQRLKKEFKDE